ncbi:hypothetical protein QTP86_000257 [Hemibagrus guttatus]|nr:hypothetical protein QTP86_000257 [Hemibagrus guttatus]
MSPHMDMALASLCLRGIHVLNYLDNWLILAHSKAMAASHRDVLLVHMRCRINPEKCVLSSFQRTTFLGVIWDSTMMCACLSPARVASILSAVNAIRLDQSLSVAEAQSVLGLMVASANVIPLGLLHMRPFLYPLSHPAPLGLDALVQTWPRLHLYAFPSVVLLPQVLARVCHNRVHLLLVAPRWPARVLFANLVSLLGGTPLEIPIREDLLSQA